MRENRLRSIWRAGETAINGWLQIPSAFSAELMAHQGWDSLTLDLQHGVLDYECAVSLLQAISTTEATPLARVPWKEPAMVMKMLDAGAYGVICPMVNNRADAEAFVGACRYPPQGYRSFGPTRAQLYGGADYQQYANEVVIAMALIETAEALENLDDILSTPGLDAVYIGPADLGLSLGLSPHMDSEEPELVAAIDNILEAARGHGLVAGIHALAPDYARRMVDKGFSFVSIASDSRLLAAAARSAVSALRGA